MWRAGGVCVSAGGVAPSGWDMGGCEGRGMGSVCASFPSV